MLKYALASLFLFLAGIAGFLLWHTGYFKDVTIGSVQKGTMILVFRDHTGPYHKIPPVIEGVETELENIGTPCDLAFGRYLDDPKTVDHDRLRSQGGCVFSPPIKKEWTDSGLKILEIPPTEFIVATFNGSPSIGPFKVYPKVLNWMKKYGYKISAPTIELYKTLPDASVLTTYLFEYE